MSSAKSASICETQTLNVRLQYCLWTSAYSVYFVDYELENVGYLFNFHVLQAVNLIIMSWSWLINCILISVLCIVLPVILWIFQTFNLGQTYFFRKKKKSQGPDELKYFDEPA